MHPLISVQLSNQLAFRSALHLHFFFSYIPWGERLHVSLKQKAFYKRQMLNAYSMYSQSQQHPIHGFSPSGSI
jgi:hypothetical protein